MLRMRSIWPQPAALIEKNSAVEFFRLTTPASHHDLHGRRLREIMVPTRNHEAGGGGQILKFRPKRASSGATVRSQQLSLNGPTGVLSDRNNRRLADASYTPPMLAIVRAFLRDESAATATEYGPIAAGISVAIIAVVNGLGTKLKTTFSSISSQLK